MVGNRKGRKGDRARLGYCARDWVHCDVGGVDGFKHGLGIGKSYVITRNELRQEQPPRAGVIVENHADLALRSSGKSWGKGIGKS